MTQVLYKTMVFFILIDNLFYQMLKFQNDPTCKFLYII